MFNQEQINTLYDLVNRGVVTEEDVKSFLKAKLVEIGFVVTPPPAPPAEVVPPTPEGEQPAVDPNQPVA